MSDAIAAEAVSAAPQRARLGLLGWSSLVIAACVLAPILAVVGNIFRGSGSAWAHLASTVLPGYVGNTILLVVMVAAGVVSIGVLSAWLVTAYRFPGHRQLEWALILPLAMPAYVMAYAYTDWLQFTGPVQTWLRDLLGWKAGDYWFPEIRSLYGAAAMFAFALYPYVYLLARSAFLEQSRTAIEAGRLLGYSAWGSFWRVALPLARPAVAAGTALALMETLADFGVVSYFAVQTFTTGIYRAWLSLGDVVAAAQLSACLLGFVLIVLVLERMQRGGARFAGPRKPTPPYALRGWHAAVAFVLCAAPIIFGFMLPGGVLLHLAVTDPDARIGTRLYGLIANSATLSGVTAGVAVLVAVLLAYAGRLSKSVTVQGANRLAALGYAMPGAVLAVGILVPLGKLDNVMADWIFQQFGIKTGLLLTGSGIALVYACLVRYLAVAFQTAEAGLARVTPSMDDAARSLGLSPARTLVRVHVPMVWGSLLTAALLVFVDVMKELPMTFAMRPFNFDTLAVEAYNLTKDERLAEAAIPSLVIVAIGLVPLIVLSRQIARSRRLLR
ncbi:MAG: iron ABC transporter permease [Betaproteobacteria bacterium]|jgi:iron(III) transport system permease protein|nr:iron ABC transporter permease [Betaproteobacteria bacterium]